MVGDYPDDPRLGSSKVHHRLRDELGRLGHGCDLLMAPDLGTRPADGRLRWAAGPALAAKAVARALRARGPYDVVDAASAEGMWIAARRRAGGMPGTAVVSRSHGLEHLNYRRMLDDAAAGILHKPWTRRLWYPAVRLSQVAGAARLADRLIVLNDADADFAAERGWKARGEVDVVPHGVSERLLADVPPSDAGRGEGLLFVGAWTEMKGTPYLTRAMGMLAAEGAAPTLTVLGPGIAEEDVVASFPEEARPHVRVLPKVGEDEVVRRLRAHDLLVHPSTYEGFGMALLEAMGQRLPVVATPQGAAATLVRDGVTGLLVPPRDSATLAAAIRRAMGDAGLRRRLADAAFDVAREMTWRRTAERTVEVYERALGRG